MNAGPSWSRECFDDSASTDADARSIHCLRIWHSRAGGLKFRHSGNIHVQPNSLLALPRHT